MHSRRLRLSALLVALLFALTGARGNKKVSRKQQSPFEKLRKEYLLYKNSTKEKEEDSLRKFLQRFEKYVGSKHLTERIQSSYYTGDIYEKLYESTKNERDLSTAYDIYLRLSTYEDSFGLAARKKIEMLGMSRKQGITEAVPPPVTATKQAPESRGVHVGSIKHWSNETYTRVVLELSGETVFEHRLLSEDPEHGKPKRIVIDIRNAVTETGRQVPIEVGDNLLQQVRVGQFKDDVARVVMDLKSIGSYSAFALKDPCRIVVDIYASGKPAAGSVPDSRQTGKIQERVITGKELKSTVKKIVVDMGHGAHDPGAVGYKGLKEKDVVLDIGLKIGELIQRHFPDIEVIFTRQSDIFLSLEERTAVANTRKADLFISVHANASKNTSAHGVETYFLNFAKEERAVEVAARENATTLQGVDEVQNILRDLIVSSKYNESSLFASFVQRHLVSRLQSDYQEVNDLGVKQAPFYVLIGAAMPSILVETSFISNPREGARLAEERYRSRIAEGIFEGVREYITKTAIASVRSDDRNTQR